MTVWAEAARDVFVLGAGFSRAISNAMPLTDGLGNACLEVDELRADPRVPNEGFVGGRFEQWLSVLAEPQPFLAEHQNLENQALFLRFARAIAAVLGDCTSDVLAAPPPDWLLPFVTAAHCRRSTLITFNYDLVLECAVKTRSLFQPGYRAPLFWAEVIGDVPNWPSGAMRLAAEQEETLRLLKLHGSLNWYWTPGDFSGVSLARRDLPGEFGAPEPYSEEHRRRELPGREVFLVPPSTTKSTYYRNPVVRELWTQAADALAGAQQVALLGYSIPLADSTVSAMLQLSLGVSSAPVMIADTNPDQVAARVLALGVAPERISATINPTDPVGEFARTFCRETSTMALEASATGDSDSRAAPLAVIWSADQYGAVIAMEVQNDEIVLVLEPPTYQGAAMRPRQDRSLPTLGDVLEAAPPAAAWIARDHTGAVHEILDSALQRWNTGYGDGKWNLLTTGGVAPPSS